MHYRTCCLCEAMCGLKIEQGQSAFLSIKADEDDVFSQGHICPKAVALQDIHNDPDRIREPLRRTKTGWEVIDWVTAFDEVASRFKLIQKRYGADSLATYLGNPNAHHYGTLLFIAPLLKVIGSRNRFSVTSVDHLPHALASTLLFGNQFSFPVPDIDRTQFFLCIGANPVVSGGSLMAAPGISQRFKDLQQRGGQLVVVDPCMTATAKLADKHFFIKPGADAWLLLGLINVIFKANLWRLGKTKPYIQGLQEFRRSISDVSLDKAAHMSGIGASDIESLAFDFAKSDSAIAYGRVGSCTQPHGTITAWLIYVLNILTGNLDRIGGVMFPQPAVDIAQLAALSKNSGHFDQSKSRVNGLPEFSGEYPVATLADEILTAGEGQIKALLTLAGNPVLSTPNGQKMDRALKSLDFMVSIDFYLNETTRHADIILPPTGPLEHPHYSLGVHAVATRNTAKYSPTLFSPPKGARHDWQILLELINRLGHRSGWQGVKNKLQAVIFRMLGADGLLDILLRMGPYGSFNPWTNKLTLVRLKRSTHGIDYGPLKPCLEKKLFTQDKKIHLFHQVYKEGLERLKKDAQRQPSDMYDLLLIGRRDVRSNNSWMHNSVRLVKGRPRCTLLLNHQDAERLSIENGQMVTLSSRTGKVEINVELSDAIMQGVVSMPHGWGHNRKGARLSVANNNPGVSLNDLSDEKLVDPLSGVAVLNGIPVRIDLS